ncbi:MAG: glycosyltransferase family 9 protein, partial [Bacteroidota bacterium]
VNIAGETTIQELIELLRIAKICITNDTGTMHVAAVLQVPTVAIFNSKLPPTWWFPDNNQVVQIFSNTDCSLCDTFNCETRECLMNIRVDHVENAVVELMSAA